MAEPILFQLNPRLKAVAEWVRKGKKFVDVGTDHAYLPIWLLKCGMVSQAIATDLREGPLLRATHNAFRYRVQTKLILRLCDGLAGVASQEAEDIAIAGMGGELIAQILQRTPWVRDPEKQWIFQPMTGAEELRGYLSENGFSILQERAVLDSGRVYTVMLVRYTGEPQDTSAFFRYVGRLNPKESPEAADYIRQQLRHLNNICAGHRARGEKQQEQETAELIEKMNGLL